MSFNTKIIVCIADELEERCSYFLKEDWTVKHIVAENVSCSFGNSHHEMRGKIIIVLER
jgi:hypothetical protein